LQLLIKVNNIKSLICGGPSRHEISVVPSARKRAEINKSEIGLCGEKTYARQVGVSRRKTPLRDLLVRAVTGFRVALNPALAAN